MALTDPLTLCPTDYGICRLCETPLGASDHFECRAKYAKWSSEGNNCVHDLQSYKEACKEYFQDDDLVNSNIVYTIWGLCVTPTWGPLVFKFYENAEEALDGYMEKYYSGMWTKITVSGPNEGLAKQFQTVPFAYKYSVTMEGQTFPVGIIRSELET